MPTQNPSPDSTAGAQRVKSPDAVTAQEPAIGEADPSTLKDAMRAASQGDRSQDAVDDEEAMKRQSAHGPERQNNAGD